MIKAKPKKPKAPSPTLTQIAEELGVSISTVWRWKRGIPGKHGGDNFRKKQFKAALKKLGEQAGAV